jgi:hypothetical protein
VTELYFGAIYNEFTGFPYTGIRYIEALLYYNLFYNDFYSLFHNNILHHNLSVETSAECTQDECLPDQLLNVFINH